MFQQMINGSIAVLTKPSVAVFEEHEKNNLTWALIYSVIAGLINAVFAAIGAAIGIGAAANTGSDITGGDAAVLGGGIVAALFFGIIATIIGLLISWGVTYLLGRAFGGTGQFGELAYDLALFSAPLTVVGSILNLIPFIGSIAAFALGIYNLYLTYLAIQSGMNLPSNKALYVILIEFAIVLVLAICVGVSIGALLAGAGAIPNQ